LQRGSSAPHRTPHAVCDARRREPLQTLRHQRPRTFGRPTSVWTLQLAADVAVAEGMPPRPVRGATIRHALAALKTRWTRAKRWRTSPDPADVRKQNRATGSSGWRPRPPDWARGFADAVCWSRLAQPAMHAWTPSATALRLVEQARSPDDADPTALACYGLLVRAQPTRPEQLGLRCAVGQPVSGLTTQVLAWCCEHLAARGRRALLLMWDHSAGQLRPNTDDAERPGGAGHGRGGSS
jgi:hypothetical protein